MSYTIPQYVDTKEQAVLAVASAIADEDKSALGDGSVNKALDVLADVLAQQDVSVPQTNAGAILALAQYVTGGGGGGVDVGEPVPLYMADATPVVGEEPDYTKLCNTGIIRLWHSDKLIVGNGNVASGMTVRGFSVNQTLDDVRFYHVEYDEDTDLVASVDDVTASVEKGYDDEDGDWFTVPAIEISYGDLVIVGIDNK